MLVLLLLLSGSFLLSYLSGWNSSAFSLFVSRSALLLATTLPFPYLFLLSEKPSASFLHLLHLCTTPSHYSCLSASAGSLFTALLYFVQLYHFGPITSLHLVEWRLQPSLPSKWHCKSIYDFLQCLVSTLPGLLWTFLATHFLPFYLMILLLYMIC